MADSTQIHTHLCYSEFGEVIGAIADLDADVTSIEAARSHMEVLDDLNAIGFSNSVGPGVYDIHSPRVPSTEEIAESLRAALKAVPAERLWVNPDCGLKTRNADEVTASLQPWSLRPRKSGRPDSHDRDAGGAERLDGLGGRRRGHSRGQVEQDPGGEAGGDRIGRGGLHAVVGGDAHDVDIVDLAGAQPVGQRGAVLVGPSKPL